MLFIELSILQRILKNNHGFHINATMIIIPKDHVTLKTGMMDAENPALTCRL